MRLPPPLDFFLPRFNRIGTRTTLLFSLAVGVLLVAPSQVMAINAAQLKASTNFKALELKARTNKIRVIAEAKLDTNEVSLLNQRNKGREKLRSSIRLKGLKEEKVLDDLPLLVYEVDAEELNILSDSGLVENIVEDRLNKPHLVQSMAFIGGNIAHNFNMKGNTAAVAILDSGVNKDHPMLTGRVIAEACYSTTSVPQSAQSVCPNGSTSQTGTGAAAPCGESGCWHGTHVASIAAGVKVGSYGPGVAPQANIVAVQVFTKFTSETQCGTGISSCIAAYDSDIIKGLNYVKSIATANKIAAANMSLGGGKYTSACTSSVKTAIDNLRTYGVVTVISSGNDGYSDGISSPGCISTALTVGSTKDNSNTISSYSNSASFLDMLAPGESITAAYQSSYATASGTSQAAPHVTGAIALLKGYNNSYTAQQMEDLVKQNGVTVTDARNGFSFPRLDIGKMTQTVAGPTYVPTITINQPANNTFVNKNSVILSATATDNQDGNISANITWKSNISGAITSPASLSAGAHTITATIVDSTGFTSSASVNITASNAPTTTITLPASNITIAQGQSVTLTGTASDTEDGNISANIQWTSSISGNLGTGASINKILAYGNHTITASVVDSDDLTPTTPATRTINVTCNDCDNDGMPDTWETQYDLTNPNADEDQDGLSNLIEYQNGSHPRDAAPTLMIISPEINLVSDRAAILAGAANDNEDGNLSANIQWSSDTEGTIGTGNNIPHNFTIGTHIISATVNDSKGASPVNNASITVNVGRLGDINDDNKINTADLFLLQKYLSGESVFSSLQLQRADLYPVTQGDANITTQDLLLLEKKLIE